MSDRTKKKITYTSKRLKANEKRDRLVFNRAFLAGRRNHMRAWHIKLGDEVMVINGDDKGKTGKVLRVLSKLGKVIVEGVNIVKRHTKSPNQAEGEIKEKPLPIDISNVSLFIADENGKNRPTRVRRDAEGRRIAVANGQTID